MDYLWHELMLHHYTLYVNRFLKKPGKFSSKGLPRHEPYPAAALGVLGHEFVGADAAGVVQAGEPVARAGVG